MTAVAKKPPQNKRMVSIRLSEPLIAQAEKFADKHHRTFTTVLELALAEYLKRYGHLPPLEDSLDE